MMAEEAAPAEQDDGKVAVTIDGRNLRVPKGTLLLDAATVAGIHIPIYCAHPKMDPVAVCRMCLVRVEKMAKLVPACATPVNDGMVVTTNSAEVAKMREGVLEFLLLNHPLDCPVCDRGGECDLQDFAFRYGPQTSRFPITDKVHFDKARGLSDRIELDQERCILCWRCTRYYEEITGEKELVLQQRGVHTVIDTYEQKPLQSRFQGNLPEICPVGALTHIQYRFQARPWELQRTPSVCPECSYGCNIFVDRRDFDIKRFASRDNPLVDDMWLCDQGRYSATSWNDRPRIRRPAMRDGSGRQEDVTLSDAVNAAAMQLDAVVKRHGADAVAVFASSESTNEELWLLQRLAREVLGTPHLNHSLDPIPRLAPEEHSLAIADIESCSAIVVLGGEPEERTPVLSLRLFKAETKRGVAVHRVAGDADPGAITTQVGTAGDGARPVGLVADESNRESAARVAEALERAGWTVRRLTTTRGVNGRGAKDLGMLPDRLPGYRPVDRTGKWGREVLAGCASGSIKALLLLDGSRALQADEDSVSEALRGLDAVVAIETRPGAVASAAGVLIPGHAYFEKEGTVTNVEGRVQRITRALPPAAGVPGETRVLSMLASALGADDWGAGDPATVHRELRDALPAYGAAGRGGRAVWRAS